MIAIVDILQEKKKNIGNIKIKICTENMISIMNKGIREGTQSK